jgi:tryptophan synthase beta chain
MPKYFAYNNIQYGGQYVPETLMPALIELDEAYQRFKKDAELKKELTYLLQEYAGRPTPLYHARNLSEKLGCKIYLKREDLLHGGAHKTNNVLGQALLAREMKKTRLIAETGAGMHGAAAAMMGAFFNIPTEIYMGVEDIERQRLNVMKMKLYGAKLNPVEVRPGIGTLKDAINEALRDWVTNVRTTFYLFGTVAGPHPYPTMVRDFQRIIGREIKEQILQKEGHLPTAVIACVGGGSNAIGAFYDFIPDEEVNLLGAEAGGQGVHSKKHGAALTAGCDAILHGSLSKALTNDDGQIEEAYSISAGLDYPGVGPEHVYLQKTGRASYHAVTDTQAIDALKFLSHTEGIIPALESAHAVALAIEYAKKCSANDCLVINISGRGDKDMDIIKGHI